MQARITIDPEIRHGKPVIHGTRVPVSRVVADLAGGASIEDTARQYDIDEADVRAALAYAAERVDDEAIYPLRLPLHRPATG